MSQKISLFTSLEFKLPGIVHAFFGRTGGVSEGYYDSLNCSFINKEDPLDRVLENRRRALEALTPQVTHLCLNEQIHSPIVQSITALPHVCAKADGMVTNLSHVALGIQTADCVPILFSCEKTKVIGACHAGWKGALAGIVGNTVAAMKDLGASNAAIRAVVGPCIAQASYDVGPEFYDNFVNAHSENDRFFTPTAANKFLFDIRGYVHYRLEEAGLVHISHVRHDTCAEEDHFFSNRRRTIRGEPTFGGQISMIAKVT